MKDRSLIVRDIYQNFYNSTHRMQDSSVFSLFWKRKIPIKITIFGWLTWKGRVITWDNWRKRGHHGPGWCVFCSDADESIHHLFFTCPSFIQLWKLFSSFFMDPSWLPRDFLTAALEWDKLHCQYRSLPFFFIWEIWLARNRKIFDQIPIQPHKIYFAIKSWMDVTPSAMPDIIDGSRRIRPHDISLPAVYFDGAAADGSTGCGAWIKISGHDRYHISWNGGPGSNNKAEVMALWGALFVAFDLQILVANIFGDSKLVIGWITNESRLETPHLQGWVERTRQLWNLLNCPPIFHIFRENNTRADRLSKRGLLEDFELLIVSHFQNGIQTAVSHISLP